MDKRKDGVLWDKRYNLRHNQLSMRTKDSLQWLQVLYNKPKSPNTMHGTS